MRLFMQIIPTNILPFRDQRKNKTESNEISYTKLNWTQTSLINIIRGYLKK